MARKKVHAAPAPKRGNTPSYEEVTSKGNLVLSVGSKVLESEDGTPTLGRWFLYALACPEFSPPHEDDVSLDLWWVNHERGEVARFNQTPLGSLFHLTIGE